MKTAMDFDELVAFGATNVTDAEAQSALQALAVHVALNGPNNINEATMKTIIGAAKYEAQLQEVK